jgi:hypothetical protein
LNLGEHLAVSPRVFNYLFVSKNFSAPFIRLLTVIPDSNRFGKKCRLALLLNAAAQYADLVQRFHFALRGPAAKGCLGQGRGGAQLVASVDNRASAKFPAPFSLP